MPMNNPSAVSGAGNNMVLGMGDSIMRCQGIANNTASFLEYWAAASNGTMKIVGNLGTNGAKTADLISSQLATAVASSAQYVVVMEAANDALNSVSVTTHRANMVTILQALLAARKVPILVGAPPLSGYNIWQYNAADQQTCIALGVKYINPWSGCALNGSWRDSTYSLDNVHPYPKASRIAGAAAWVATQGMFVGTPDIAWTSALENSMLTNCLNLTNVAGVPTGWTGAAGLTHSCAEAGTGEVIGNWWKMTATAITGWQVNTRTGVALPSGWAAGDTARMSARLRSVGFEANSGAANATYPTQGAMGCYISLAWTGGTAGSMILREIDADVNGVFSIDGIIPAGTTGANFSVVVTQQATVSGEFSVAQLQVHNPTLAARLA